MRCKQIYLIRTPCSHCIQSHFLWRQKRKNGFGSKILHYRKDLNCWFPSLKLKLKTDFYLFIFIPTVIWRPTPQASWGWSRDHRDHRFLEISFDVKPFYLVNGDNTCGYAGEAGPWSNLFRWCISRPELHPLISCLHQGHEMLRCNLSKFHHYSICVTQRPLCCHFLSIIRQNKIWSSNKRKKWGRKK